MLKRILGEPLVHFLGLAIVIFAGYGLLGGESFSARERIEVSAARIEQLGGLFAKTWQRPPTSAEMKGLIDDYVAEEIYYREARRLGLDEGDTVIRRRMRLKMELITDAAVDQMQPSNEDLGNYFGANRDKFRFEPELAFEQVFLNPERHGAALEADATALLASLRDRSISAETAGDQTLLPSFLPLSPRSTIARDFGDEFANAIGALPSGNWEGPIKSGYGLHLVRIVEKKEGRLPKLDEIRDIVEREWKAGRRKEMQKQRLNDLARTYDIIIETTP